MRDKARGDAVGETKGFRVQEGFSSNTVPADYVVYVANAGAVHPESTRAIVSNRANEGVRLVERETCTRIEFSLLPAARNSSAAGFEIHRSEVSSNIARIRSLSSSYGSNPCARLSARVGLLGVVLAGTGCPAQAARCSGHQRIQSPDCRKSCSPFRR